MADQQDLLRSYYNRGLAQGRELVNNSNATTAGGLAYWHDAARCLAELLGWPTRELVAKVVAYHRERMDAVPDLSHYPELRGYRDRLDAEERGLADGGVPADDIALLKSLNFYRDVRLQEETGRAWYTAVTPEKCRVVYCAETDVGAIRAKNVDDPLTYWKPRPPFASGTPWPYAGPLVFDGVGSGLHMDEAPPEIFPVDARSLCVEHCTTVPEATEFMVRYNYFWASQNLIIHDMHGNAMAFEKTRCRVATRGLNSAGITFITGMGALDPDIAAHQKAMRQKYLDQMGWTWDDSPDGCFFTVCENKWKNLTAYVEELSIAPTFDNLKQVMEQRDKDGPMCLTGTISHRDQTTPGCTLVMDMWMLDQKRLHRRQWRGTTPAYLDTPEIVQFT